MVRYQYQGVPVTPPTPTLSVVSGSTTSAVAGTKSFWLQYRNRVGFSLTSNRVQTTITAGQGINVTIPEAALPDPNGTYIWEYVLLMSDTGLIADACVVATVPGVDSDETTILTPPFTVPFVQDQHFALSEIVATVDDLPEANLLNGMRRLVDATNTIVEWDQNLTVWSTVKPQVFNTYITSVVGTYGAHQDISAVLTESIIYPEYGLSIGETSIPVGFWLANDGSQNIVQGTRIGITVENGSEDVSYTLGILGGIELIFRGYVNTTTGVLDITSSDGVTDMDDINVTIPYQGKKTGLVLPKDLQPGWAYWIDVQATITPELLNNRITQGSSLMFSCYFYADFAVWNPSGAIFGDFITADGDRRRVFPSTGNTAIAKAGSGNITLPGGGSLAFNNVGEQSVTGFTLNQSNQSVWVGVDGTCLTSSVQPNGTRLRALIGTLNGVGFATAWAGSLTLNGSTQLRVTVNYPVAIRSDYPDVISGLSATLNATYVRIYVRPTTGGTIVYFDELIVPGTSQQFTVGSTTSTTVGTTLPSPASTDFGLFTPVSFTPTTVVGDSSFAAGTYEVAIAFRYEGVITSISHSSLNGCIFEAGVTLAEAFDRSQYYSQPVSDLTTIDREDIVDWETRIQTTDGIRYKFNPTATAGLKPGNQASITPGRWISETGDVDVNSLIPLILIYS